jgi:hypothetical protein
MCDHLIERLSSIYRIQQRERIPAVRDFKLHDPSLLIALPFSSLLLRSRE